MLIMCIFIFSCAIKNKMVGVRQHLKKENLFVVLSEDLVILDECCFLVTKILEFILERT